MPLRSAMFSTAPTLHPITINIVLVDHNIANIDTGTDLNAIIFGNGGIATRHATLNFHRATHCIDRARKFDQQAIACGFDDTTVMLGNFWINKIAAMSLQRSERPFLVIAHKAAIARDICCEDGR